jgi:hypothetical protein
LRETWRHLRRDLALQSLGLQSSRRSRWGFKAVRGSPAVGTDAALSYMISICTAFNVACGTTGPRPKEAIVWGWRALCRLGQRAALACAHVAVAAAAAQAGAQVTQAQAAVAVTLADSGSGSQGGLS